jgi:phenylacetate-CoA ligase
MFARYLIRKKIVLNNICQTLKCCITTSEVLTIEDRELLLRAFGVKVVNEYGVSEAGQMAIENNQGDWLLADEISNIELIEDESGKINGTDYGRIVITDLDNKAMPFIRYNIGDLGIISKELSENGKNRKLEKLLGRENDNIYLPSGKISPGFTLYYVSRSILESTGVLKEYIIRQTKLDEFIFEVVTNEPLTEYQENDIKKKVEIYLEPGLNLVINRVEKIVRPPSGKIKHFHSEIS